MSTAIDRIWTERKESLAAPERNPETGEIKTGRKLVEKVVRPIVKLGEWKVKWVGTLPVDD